MKTITLAGGDLFRIAMAELGDATQWVRIARLNGIDDPMLAGLNALRIPPRDANWAGGLDGGGVAEF
jgi:hypothetical protein